MKRTYRSFIFWILLAIGVPSLISFILNKSFSAEHGIRVHSGSEIWMEPTFHQAFKHIWEKKLQDPIDLETYVWVWPGEKHFLIFKGAPRKIYFDGALAKDLSRKPWCMTEQPVPSGLHNILIRIPGIPPESPTPEFFWSRAYIASEQIGQDRLFLRDQSNRALNGILLAKSLAILARLNCVLLVLIPVVIAIYRKMDPAIRKPGLAFLVLFLIMVFLRFYGLTYQLEEGIHPDERAVENISAHFRAGDLKPQTYFYTPGFHYMTAGIENLAAWVLGHDLPPHVGPRFLSALFSSLSCLVVFSIGNAIVGGSTAMTASALFGFTFLPVQLAHFGIIESTMVFFFLLGVRTILNLSKGADAKAYLKAGLASGLAVGIKQTAAIICIPFFFMYFFANGKDSLRWNAIKKIFWWGLGAAATYVLLCPFTLLDFPRFLHDQIFQLRFLSGGTHTALYFVEDPSGTKKILEYLDEGIGYPIFIAAAIGCILIWKYSPKGFFAIVPITVLFFIIASMVKAAPYHYPLLLCPFLALLAAIAVTALTTRIWRAGTPAPPAIYAIAILTVALLIPSFLRIVRLEQVLSGIDTRRQCSEWCYRNLPLGSRIDYEQFGPRFLIPVFRSLMIPLWTRNTWEEYMKIRIPEYVIIDSTTADIFLKKSREAFPQEHEWFEGLRQNGILIKEFSGISFGQYNPHVMIYKIPKKDVSPP
jgi:hypothetical protein